MRRNQSFNHRVATFAFAALCLPSVALAQQVPKVGPFNPTHSVLLPTHAEPRIKDPSSTDSKHPGVTVLQRIPKGDTMTAMITVDNQIYHNDDGTTPTWTRTSDLANAAVTFFIPGMLDIDKRKLIPTDINQMHTDPALVSGIVQLSAYAPDPGMLPLGSFLLDNFGHQELNVPDFISTSVTNLYFGVDLTVWASQGPDSFALDSTFTIVDGVSSELPGYLFSTAPLTSTDNGWATTTPYDGTATLDSFHGLTATIPEPSSLALAAFGILALFIARSFRAFTSA